jgi:hypothetical protein
MRDAPGGPYVLAPDSTDWVPPDALAVPLADLKKVEEKVIESSNALDSESPEEQVLVPKAQRDYLREAEDPAADRLLEVLERGVQGAAGNAGVSAEDTPDARTASAGSVDAVSS